eukprot:NODE_8378_length_360_cov_60.527331_g6630_i0.p2 GENE.NODE_8378_length_360_cov_60.527331_g6630_i0~~NODE_8378_length_360_cov_60.527331_g6630_i0.p2  ORF type:complete len:64 (-),score=25.02 NODE_8378_length_360_cov_60.527331_g6630_i0:137-328(-)
MGDIANQYAAYVEHAESDILALRASVEQAKIYMNYFDTEHLKFIRQRTPPVQTPDTEAQVAAS